MPLPFAPWRQDALPLVNAAERFLRDHPGAPETCDSGVKGLKIIAHAIDDWLARDTVSSTEDERFVEGVGALFGLVLLDHIGIGRHVCRERTHRIQLGTHGFYDPFKAIEDVMEANASMPAMVEEVRRAEAEAHAKAGYGRVQSAFETQLAQRRPDLRIMDRFQALVWLEDEIEIDLSRVLSATHDQSQAALDIALQKLIHMLPGGERNTPATFASLTGRLVPRLVGERFLNELDTKAETLALQPLFDRQVHIAIVEQCDDRSRFVRKAEILNSKYTFDEVLAQALRNLAERSTHARFATLDTELGPMVATRTGDGLDAARILLPNLHNVLSPVLGSSFLVAIPHRDALWACPSDNPALIVQMRARVQKDHDRAPHQISATLFLVTEDGIQIPAPTPTSS